MSERGGSEDKLEWMGDMKDEEDELDSGWERGVQGLGNNSDSDSDLDDKDDKDDVIIVIINNNNKDKDKVLTDNTSLSDMTLVNNDSDWMDEDTDDDVKVILRDLNTDKEIVRGHV